MWKTRLIATALAGLAAAALPATTPAFAAATFMPSILMFDNATGVDETVSSAGPILLSNPFFQSLGGNGRACVSCHQPSAGWSITPANVEARFDATGGTDPIFRTNDGSVSPDADVSTVAARRKAYAMLLTKALIRVGIGVPANAEFDLVGVDDPYGHASASELSLFRRVLPSTNLGFISTVMWDGRETFKDTASNDCLMGTTTCFASIHVDLADQASGATTGHAQAPTPPTAAELDAIVAFEASLTTAQAFDDDAGPLRMHHADGGPRHLAHQPFYFGINDVLARDYRTGATFNPTIFTMYDDWADKGSKAKSEGPHDGQKARASVYRGQQIFNSRTIRITGVAGLNDDLDVAEIDGTCGTCHDAPGAGSHSVPVPLNIGISDASRRTPDMPLYTLRHKVAPFEVVQTTDPGRALITGAWKDIGKFKGPVLRALASRPPYFHNGSAKDLAAVVDFYDTRFAIGLTDQDKRDLVAFLRTL
jgi:hypothetical protein